MCGGKEVQEGIGKSAGEWHFTLGGKIPVDANDLSPKEATVMSRDIKYIGYLALEIANTMWPSGLCRAAVP